MSSSTPARVTWNSGRSGDRARWRSDRRAGADFHSEALDIDSDYEVGEECYEQLELEDFGRRAIMAARQTLISRIMELEKDEVYRRYSDRVGEMVICEVNQIMKRDILVIDDATNNELVLPRNEMIRGDFFRKG